MIAGTRCLSGNHDFLALETIPGRDPVSPPELSADTPVMDVVHPVEDDLLEAPGDKPRVSLLDSLDRRPGQRSHLNEPLSGHEWFNDRVATLAMAHLVGMILDPIQESFLLEILYHPSPGLEPVQARVRSSLLRHYPVFPDDTDARKLVATPGFKVVGIVSGRHLSGSCSKLTIHERVRDQRDLSLHQGKDHSLPDELLEPARRASKLFPLMVPESYLSRIQPSDPRDPLLLQVLPLGAEAIEQPGFLHDAVGDAQVRRAPGLLHKYAGRALMIATGSCAIHCRYCFRRHYPYGQEPRRMHDWEPAFQAIEADSSLREIILSGGDPLMLTDRRLGELCGRLSEIPHLKRLRIHSRLPVVLPDRVNPELIELFRSNRLTPIVVVHANHPHELETDCAFALRTLVRSGLTVLNQAVLLRGVNDSIEALAGLCERLVDLGVIPYYLHQLDRVKGTAHFEVPRERGRELIGQLRGRLPGYAIPQYVREIPGEPHKMPML